MKTEPLEAVPGVGLGESPTLTESEDAMDHEQIQAADEEQERMEADGEPGNALQDTGDAGERIPIVVGGSSIRLSGKNDTASAVTL